MTPTQKIETALKQSFPNCQLELIDNSHLHAGHEGAKEGKGHFLLNINVQAEEKLKQKTLLQQHRLIHQALAELFETDIHALEIKKIK